MTNLDEKEANDNEVDITEVVQDDDEESNNNSFEREFPNPFYDPITGNVMKEPVVNPAGDSYDKSSLASYYNPTNTTNTTFYPNRALQSIIEHEIKLGESSIKGSLRRFDDALQRGLLWGHYYLTSSKQYPPLPESYYCPITCDLIVDPVISPDGITYEREAIANWVRVNGTSPVTRDILSLDQLRSNNNLYELIQCEKERTSDSIHPDIRRWKESGVNTTRPDSVMYFPAPTTQSTTRIIRTTTFYPAPNTYPTTQAEINARRRRQQQQHHTNQVSMLRVSLCFVTIFIFIVVAFFGFLFLYNNYYNRN